MKINNKFMEDYEFIFEKEKINLLKELNNKDKYNEIIYFLNEKYNYYYENKNDNKYIKRLILDYLDYLFMAYIK